MLGSPQRLFPNDGDSAIILHPKVIGGFEVIPGESHDRARFDCQLCPAADLKFIRLTPASDCRLAAGTKVRDGSDGIL